MPHDPTVQVAIVGVLTTFITTIGVIIVAVMNNRRERGDAAEEGIAGTLRERIVLRDEQLAEARQELEEKNELIMLLREELRSRWLNEEIDR